MKSFFLFACICCFYCTVQAQTFADPNFAAIPIASGWNQPVGAAFNSTGQQLFVWERGGKVYVCNRDGSGNYIKQTQPVLDISPEVGDWNAHGMLGFALDPNFESNGLIYVMYVVNRNHLFHFGTPQYNPNAPDGNMATIGRITRYKTVMNAGTLTTDYGSRYVLLGETPQTGMPILHDSHGVGSLVFAADGTLLASIGDAASYEGIDAGSYPGTYWQQALQDGIIRPEENVGAYRSQMINSFNGKILRIDPQTGDGLSSNPFYDPSAPRAPKSRVWALGVRNAFRFSIKPNTGSTDPAAGDVGEIFYGDVGFSTWEELSVVTQKGQNMGWPIYEGIEETLHPDGHTNNTYADLNIENRDEPNPLYNGTTCTRQYFYFRELLRNENIDQDKTVYNPCNPAQPIGSGNRYYHKRPSLEWSHAHQWARIPIFDDNNNPAWAMIGSPEAGVPGTPFPGSCSVGGVWYNGDTYPADYKNTFFTGDYAANPWIGFTPWIKSLKFDYTDHVAKVTDFAKDFNELVCITTNPIDGSLVSVELALSNGVKHIVYGGNQPPIAKPKADKIYGPSPLTVNFNGSESYDPTQGGSIVSYQWNFDGATPAASNVANPGNIVFTSDPGVPKKYEVKLTVTDNGGAQHTETIIISVNNTPPVVNIVSPPDGMTYDAGPDDIILDCIADVTDAEHGPGQLKYEWQTTLRHNSHEHREAIKNEVNSSTRIQRIGFIGSDVYYWLVELTVTDEAGLSTTDAVEIHPNVSGSQASLNGSVTLQGRPAPPNAQWQVDLILDFYASTDMSTPAFSRTVTTNSSGAFVMTAIPNGTYKIAVRNNHSLKKVTALETFNGVAKTLSFGTLLEGDISNDNFVSSADLIQLISSYNKVVGDPGYIANADLNSDGFVSSLDLILLLSNYNKLGENP